MKQFIVYFLDCKTIGDITKHEIYFSEENAIANLEKCAIDYIAELEGKKHLAVAFQNDKTEDQILKDDSLREGHYAKKEGKFIVIYEKKKNVIDGYIWRSSGFVMSKVGVFGILNCNIDDDLFTKKCGCNIDKSNIINNTSLPSDKDSNYGQTISKLKELFSSEESNFGLKKNVERKLKPVSVKPLITLSQREKMKRQQMEITTSIGKVIQTNNDNEQTTQTIQLTNTVKIEQN